MALNYSQRPFFPAHTSEDKGGSPDLVSADIIDLLPSDPFGMDIDISTTFTAITGWLEDNGPYVRNNIAHTNEDYGLFAGLNLIWSSAMRLQSFPSNVASDDKGGVGCMADKCTTGCQGAEGEVVIHPGHCAEDMMGFNHGSTSAIVTKPEDLADDFFNAVGGDPHDAFVLALSYLRTRDLLLVERVCRSLCSTIHNDTLLWRSIHIDQPLNERITDDILVQLTSRAEGNLQSLTLIKCPRITDDGLKRVLETNPKLTKLSIPGCPRLSIEGILNNVRAFKSCSNGTSGIKRIRTGGYYWITHEHFKELKLLLGSGGKMQQRDYSPHYYNGEYVYMTVDDERDIDVEVCPRCQNLRLVYDCPAEGCEVKDQCRACIICIPRCAQCGRCVHNSEYEETFSLEFVCSGCFEELPACQKGRPVGADEIVYCLG